MNILIPHSWLLEHLETEASPEEIQENVSLCGPSVERIYDIGGEPVYDIEVTTNRVDSMSVRGIAREAGVILEQFGIKAKLKQLQIPTISSAKEELPLPEIIDEKNLTRRVMCVVLKDVKRTPTPKWMGQRLEEIEQNIHDAAIDITNYVTHEIGHPIHAFDYDSIMKLGGKIIVKEAEAGKPFETLDGESYETVGGEIVFENPDGVIIDLPAIKGTTNASINQSTKNILLWVESLEPSKVRYASMTHAIRTVAAQLSEKNVDPNLAEPTLLRAVELYQDICEAKVVSELYDNFPAKKELEKVSLKLEKIDEYLGLEIEPERIEKILTDLECEVEISGEGRGATLIVQPPTFRPDIAIPADVVEEIARIYGYHNLPSKLMDTAIPTNKPDHTNFQIENRVKHYLADVGWQEIYSYSMVSEELAEQSGYKLEEHLKLKNPLTDDKIYLRRSLLPSLREILSYNSQRDDLEVFELANVYHPQKTGELPSEELMLGLVAKIDYRHFRGHLEKLLDQFFVSHQLQTMKQTAVGFQQSAELVVEGDVIGHIGLIGKKLVAAEIRFSQLLPLLKTHPNYQPIPKTMPLMEDMTFTLPKKTQVGEVIRDMLSLDKLITRVTLKDVYQQNHTFTIEYHDLENNLTVEEVAPLRKKLAELLQSQHQSKLVGQV